MFDARDLKTQRPTQPSAVHGGLPIAAPNRRAVSPAPGAARIWSAHEPKTDGKMSAERRRRRENRGQTALNSLFQRSHSNIFALYSNGLQQSLKKSTIPVAEPSLPSLQADRALLYAPHATRFRAVPW